MAEQQAQRSEVITTDLPSPSIGGAVGIDVATDSLWLVAIEGVAKPIITKAELIHPLDLAAAVRFCEGSAAVAIDSPGGPSELCHLEDVSISTKFRRARCSEVALARVGISVPWITPPAGEESGLPGWMSTGFALWDALDQSGFQPLETYPHGIFWRLAGHQLRHKQLPIGAKHRLATLSAHLELPTGIEMWSHDGLDALAAALVAWQSLHGLAECIDCSSDEWPTHDESSIWLPLLDHASSSASSTRGRVTAQIRLRSPIKLS